MKLLLKQKVFSWFDSYNIYDENENAIYKVKGEFAWGHLLRIYDENDTEVGLLKQKVFTLFPRISKKLSYTDVYEINIKNERNSVLVLLIVLSIDALHCDNGGTNG